jgi:hypothetical protein
MLKVAAVPPAGTVTLAGTAAADGFELLRLTTAPPLGAAAVRMTVPWAGLPPTNVAGLTPIEERLADVVAALAVKRREEEYGPATPAELIARTLQKNR